MTDHLPRDVLRRRIAEIAPVSWMQWRSTLVVETARVLGTVTGLS